MSDGTERGMTEAQRKIFEAAVEVFAEKGFANAATSEIARRAGVAEGTIFKHYKTKKDLLLGVVAPAILRFVAPVTVREFERVVAAPYPDFERFVRAVAADRLEFVRAHPPLVRIILQEFPFHPELRARAREAMFDKVFPLARAVVARFQTEGQLARDLPPASVLRIMASMFVGYFVTRFFLAPGEGWDDAREIDVMVRVLLRGVAPEG